MLSEFRCARCHHLLFKGSLKLLLGKRRPGADQTIEIKCDRCGLINAFTYDPEQVVEKRQDCLSPSLFDEPDEEAA